MNERPQKAPTFWLVLADRVVPLLEGSHVLGRAAEADLCFPEDTTLSRRHARLDVSATRAEIEDLGSQNGTWMGVRRIIGREPLAPGRAVRMGATTFELQVAGQPVPRLAPTSPEIPSVRASRAAESLELTTERSIDFERGLLEFGHALAAGNVVRARSLLDEYVTLVDAAPNKLSHELLDVTATVAMQLVLVTGDVRYADWVVRTHARLGRRIGAGARRMASAAAAAGVSFDTEPFESPIREEPAAEAWPRRAGR